MKSNNEYTSEYYLENWKKINESKKLYQKENRKHITELQRIRRSKQKEFIAGLPEEEKLKYKNLRKKRKMCDKSITLPGKIKLTPEEKRKKKKEYVATKRQTDPLFKLSGNLRNLIKNSLRSRGFSKTSACYKILGCTFEEFKIYIENKFTEGMTWDNYGLDGWSYDHIIPLDSANNKEDLIKLNHYTNFQPMWHIENIRKGNKII